MFKTFAKPVPFSHNMQIQQQSAKDFFLWKGCEKVELRRDTRSFDFSLNSFACISDSPPHREINENCSCCPATMDPANIPQVDHLWLTKAPWSSRFEAAQVRLTAPSSQGRRQRSHSSRPPCGTLQSSLRRSRPASRSPAQPPAPEPCPQSVGVGGEGETLWRWGHTFTDSRKRPQRLPHVSSERKKGIERTGLWNGWKVRLWPASIQEGDHENTGLENAF